MDDFFGRLLRSRPFLSYTEKMNERLSKTKSAETINGHSPEKDPTPSADSIDTALLEEFNTYTADQLKEILLSIQDHTFAAQKYLSKPLSEFLEGSGLRGGFLEIEVMVAQASVKALWDKLEGSFQKHFSIIQELEQAVSVEKDETDVWINGYLNGIKYIADHEHNFFLQTLARTFIEEGDLDVPIEKRKDMLASMWDERYGSRDGEADIIAGYNYYSVPASAQSVSDLSEDTIRDITDGLLKEYVEWRGFYGVREDYLMEKLRDDSLNDKVIDPEIFSILSVENPSINQIKTLFEHTDEKFASSISPTLGVFYDIHTGMITNVFEKKDAPTISEPALETIRSVSALLLDINQSMIDKDSEGVSDYLESNLFLKRHTGFKEELQAQLISEDGQTKLDMSLAKRVMSSLKEELSPSAVPTKSLSEVIASMELFVGDKEVFFSSLYAAFSTARMRVFFETYFDFSFADIPLHAQIQFLRYVWDKPETEVNNARDFVHKGGTPKAKANRFVSFLSLEHELKIGDKIVSFGNRVPKETADALFEKYASIIDTAETTRQFLQDEFKQNGEDKESIKLVANAMSRRATDLLAQYVMQTQNDYSHLPQELERIEIDALAFSSAFRVLKNRGDLQFEDIRGVSLETESSSDFANHKNDVNKVRQLINTAYHSEPSAFRVEVMNSFEQSLENPDTQFYVLHRYGTLLASLRLDKVRDTNGNVTSKYFGSFVSDPTYGNGRLGEAVFEKTLEMEARDNIPINAWCNPLSAITQKYIEAGFTAQALNDFGGVPSLEIVFDAIQNEKSETKHWSAERVIRESLAQSSDMVQTFSTTRPEDIPFNLINDGYMLTRYFRQDNRYYAVFERFSATEPSPSSGEKGVA